MKKQTHRRNGLAVGAMTLVTFSLGVTVAVFLAGSASASSPTTTTSTSATSLGADDPNSPGARFFVINGTVYAASDHATVGSSAFPNYTTGAVDNYYSLAHSHVDNSPFAEGTASPFDTGPIGQTAAAGNFQQSQYADARWPGGPDKATFGSQGGPYATAEADVYRGIAEASMPSNGLSGPGLKLPKGLDSKLQAALAAWKAKFAGLLGTKKPAPPTVTTPKGAPPVPTKTPTTPTATVPTPVATVTTPNLGGVTPAPPAVPSAPKAPSVPGASAMAPPRSLTAAPAIPGTPKAASSSSSADGESLLHSWTLAKLVPVSEIPENLTAKTDTTKTDTTTTATTKTDPAKTYALLQSGESSLGRVSLGGGQIVIHGIHVMATIANAGTPTYNASISVASASIGGVPVTIDQDGVHIAGHSQSLPYQQASDGLNSALKQAGIQIFLVAPEVTDCTQSSGFGGGTGGGTDTSTTSNTTTTTSDQSGTTSPCDQGGMGMSTGCDQGSSGSSGGGTPGVPTNTTTTTSSTQTDTTSTNPNSCGQTDTGAGCDQSGTGSGSTGTTTTSGATGGIGPTKTTTTTTNSSNPSGTTGSPSWCNSYSPPPMPSSCTTSGTKKGKTSTSSKNPDTTTATSPTDQTGMGTDTTNSIEETVKATGVHLVFTQPVQQSGVPAQNVEHILGEVFVDSLAEPAPPVPPLGGLGLAGSAKSSKSFSSCLGGAHKSGKTVSGGALSSSGGSSASGGGVASSGSGSGAGAGGSLASSGSSLGASAASPTSGSPGSSFPASVVHALRKPLWLLLAYVVWQLLVIGTGASIWHWRRGGAA
jgi:hypothetical protein